MGISQNETLRALIRGRMTTKKLVMASFLAALNIILTRFASIMLAGGTIRLGFGSIPLVFSGMLLGPLAGALTGIISDLLGVLILSQGAFHPGFTLSSALTCVIPGLVAMICPQKRFSFITIGASNLLVYIIVSLGLNSYWLSQLYGTGFLALIPGRALAQGIVSVISTFLLYGLGKSIKDINI